MTAILLERHQIIRKGKYPAPNVTGYDSLFFHPLTEGHDTDTYIEWGNELTSICEKTETPYFYFLNDFGIKINVYPNEVISNWWNEKKTTII